MPLAAMPASAIQSAAGTPSIWIARMLPVVVPPVGAANGDVDVAHRLAELLEHVGQLALAEAGRGAVDAELLAGEPGALERRCRPPPRAAGWRDRSCLRAGRPRRRSRRRWVRRLRRPRSASPPWARPRWARPRWAPPAVGAAPVALGPAAPPQAASMIARPTAPATRRRSMVIGQVLSVGGDVVDGRPDPEPAGAGTVPVGAGRGQPSRRGLDGPVDAPRGAPLSSRSIQSA